MREKLSHLIKLFLVIITPLQLRIAIAASIELDGLVGTMDMVVSGSLYVGILGHPVEF